MAFSMGSRTFKNRNMLLKAKIEKIVYGRIIKKRSVETTVMHSLPFRNQLSSFLIVKSVNPKVWTQKLINNQTGEITFYYMPIICLHTS